MEVPDETPPKKSRKESPKHPITPAGDDEVKSKDVKQETAENKEKEEKERPRKEEEKKAKQEREEKVKVKEDNKGDSDEDFNDFAIGLDIACVVCK